MILFRIILINIIIYLLIRSFFRPRNIDEPVKRGSKVESPPKANTKGVSKKVGEYVDYEELEN